MLAIFVDGESVETANDGDEAVIVLDKTPFYAESGGQVGDTGVISGAMTAFEVSDTKKIHSGHFLHMGVAQGAVSVGDKVTASVDKKRRSSIMRNHTAAHLLQAALRKVLGDHVHQAGQLVDGERVRFDFSHFEAVTPDELKEIEGIINTDILGAVPVTMTEMPIDEARKLGAMALFGEKYGDIVRVVNVEDTSIEFCGGTHVDNTSKLGLFKVISENSVAAGVRRIEAVTGTGVLALIDDYKNTLTEAAHAIKAPNASELTARCTAAAGELKALEKEVSELKGKLASTQLDSLFEGAVSVGSIRVIAAEIAGAKADILRTLGDSIKDKAPDVVAVIAGDGSIVCVCGKEAAAAGAHAGNIVRKVAALTGGKGGGRPDSAMAGIGDASKVKEAIAAVGDIVSEFVK